MTDSPGAPVSAATALQQALAAEHAAVYVDAALGGVTSQATSPALYAALTQAYESHRRQRDALVARLQQVGEGPVAAEAVYQLPADLSTPDRVRAAALAIERACTATYASAVAGSAGEIRADSVQALRDSALQELQFGGEPEAFPGLAELDDR